MADPSQDRVLELLDYDPETGILTRRTAHIMPNGGIKAPAGRACGWADRDGYLLINIDGAICKAHRLAWIYVHGHAPRYIDHKDLDHGNNRLINLRPCTQSQNSANTGKPKNNTSGFKGVTRNKRGKPWRATICVRRKIEYLGSFSDPSDAHAAYVARAQEVFGEFARTE